MMPDRAALPAPGMMARHYAPRAPLECVEGNARGRIEALSQEVRAGWLTFGDVGEAPPQVTVIVLPPDPAEYAARLYAALHALDDAGVESIIVTMPPNTEAWLAVRDRLRRAAAPLQRL